MGLKRTSVPLTNREMPEEKQLDSQGLQNGLSVKKLLSDVSISVAVGLFIGYLAPFGMDKFPVWQSLFYWVVTCVIGYFIYTPSIFVGERVLQNRINSHWQRVAISTAIASMLMSLAVPIITWLFFKQPIDISEQFLTVLPKALVIGGVITFFSLVRGHIKAQQQALANQQAQVEQSQQQTKQLVDEKYQQLIDQLPLEKRGDLLCLEMSDHYLKVHTDKGHHMVLMRFKDALALLDNVEGLQTHRSWWVAKGAVQSVRKENRKTVLVLSNGIEVPVSRTYATEVKAYFKH